MKMKQAICVFVVFITISSALSAQKHLKFAATEWPPYTTNTLEDGGVSNQIVTTAFNRVGYSVDFVIQPWKRAQKMVSKGALDGMGIAWYTEKRAETMVYSEPYLLNEIVLIKHTNDLGKYSSNSAYNGKHFGVLRGYGYLNLVESTTTKVTVLDNLEQSLRMLSRNRIDLTLEERLNFQTRLALLPETVQNSISFLPNPLEIKPLHITISKELANHNEIIAEFNRGLGLIRQEGKYQAIIDGYHPKPLGVK